MKVTKTLIIDEPWISKILRGEKDWEMRSTQSSHGGLFGLIRKGSGRVVGVANLIAVSGPYDNAALQRTFEHHKVGEEVFLSPVYKWRYAWQLSNLAVLPQPVPYIHKNGAVTWVALDKHAQAIISGEALDMAGEVSAVSENLSAIATSSEQFWSKADSNHGMKGIEDDSSSDAIHIHITVRSIDPPETVEPSLTANSKITTNSLLPKARDGSLFTPETCNGRGIYTIGKKGYVQKFVDFDKALEYLRKMLTAMWRRPNASGNWGVVSALDWAPL